MTARRRVVTAGLVLIFALPSTAQDEEPTREEVVNRLGELLRAAPVRGADPPAAGVPLLEGLADESPGPSVAAVASEFEGLARAVGPEVLLSQVLRPRSGRATIEEATARVTPFDGDIDVEYALPADLRTIEVDLESGTLERGLTTIVEALRQTDPTIEWVRLADTVVVGRREPMVTTPSGLKRRDLTFGTGRPIETGDSVVLRLIRYTPALPLLSFDWEQLSNESLTHRQAGKPVVLTIEAGRGHTYPAVEEALIGMARRGRRLLVAPPRLVHPVHPAGEDPIVLGVEVLSVRTAQESR